MDPEEPESEIREVLETRRAVSINQPALLPYSSPKETD